MDPTTEKSTTPSWQEIDDRRDARRHARACAHGRVSLRAAADRYRVALSTADAAGNLVPDYDAAARALLRNYECARRLRLIREQPAGTDPATEVAMVVNEWQEEQAANEAKDLEWARKCEELGIVDDVPLAQHAVMMERLRGARSTAAAGTAAQHDHGQTDDTQEYWAEQARGSLPDPIGELAARAIENCQRTKRTNKLIPGAVARRQLEEIGQSPEWAALRPTDRSMVLTLLVDGAEVFPGVVRAALGTPDKLPAPLADEGVTEPASFADIPSVHIAPIVALNVLYGGKLGLMHGPAGGGKTTVLANAVARITRGADWLGHPTIKGIVLVVTEDRDTWKDALETAGADQKMVKPTQWRDLARKVADLKPVAVVVDTMQYIASVIGSGELDSAREVDIILRPLEKLCRDHGVAIKVTDHEPWSDGSGPTDSTSGTKKRPRHSGAKVATCDFITRCSVDAGTTTIERGSKVRRGIAIDKIATVDLHGNGVAAPPSGPAKPASRLDPDGYLWPDPEIDDPLRAWFVDAAAADGKAPSWTQCRKRIRKEAEIGGGNDRLKSSYDRVAAWFAAGGPGPPTPAPPDRPDRPDRPVRESADHRGPLGRTAPDRPVRTGPDHPVQTVQNPIGGPPGPDRVRDPGPEAVQKWSARTASPPPDGEPADPGAVTGAPGGDVGAPADEPPPANGDDGDRAEGSAYWRREHDALIASGVDPCEHDCMATCCRCDRSRTRCAITPAGPVCEICQRGLPAGVRPAEDYPGFALVAAQLQSPEATTEQRQSAWTAARRVLAAEFNAAAKARGMAKAGNPYQE